MPESSTADILQTLSEGDLALSGEFVWGSNYTFLVDVDCAGVALSGVYKPTRGERPLWDFARASLAHREVAAYLVSEALGWNLVPPTVYRSNGPAGAGSLQLFISHDPEYHYFTFSPADRQRLRPTVLFDYLVNNADRKGSHLLVDVEKHIWLIDHGISFHVDDKLRTVIWDFCGEPIPVELSSALNDFRGKLNSEIITLKEQLAPHLTPAELDMLARRAEWLTTLSHFPDPPQNRRAHPWPPI